MLKKMGFSTLALAAALAVAAPTNTFARGFDNHRGPEHRDDHRVIVDHGHGGFGFGINIGVAPVVTPAAGYYDQFGVWHPYGFYDQFGVWHAY